MAFIVWRVAHNTLTQMRGAQFDIDIGPQYFAFLREWLVFLIQVVDRMAYERMGVDGRPRSPPRSCSASPTTWTTRTSASVPPGEESRQGRFIDLVNQLAPHYAEFGHDADGPDFAFMRYLGHRIEALMPEKDRHWVDGPDPPGIKRPPADLSTEPRAPRRGAMSGD
jgi:hypothetical protein